MTDSEDSNQELFLLCTRLWLHYFKYPLDNLDHDWKKVLKQLREFYFRCEWNEAYDFIEFIANNYNRYEFKNPFISACNNLLEKEMSAYRFVGSLLTRITEKEEMQEIDHAIEASAGPVATHIKRSLALLSDRNSPDYRNSIKEAISAVESLVSIVLGEKGTLGQLIKKLESEVTLHAALKSAFSNLYGYTNDEGGIRHALMENEKGNDFHDAKFMLVVCSAFINYVDGKMQDKR